MFTNHLCAFFALVARRNLRYRVTRRPEADPCHPRFWTCWVEVSGASSWTVWAPGPLGIESLWVAVLETVPLRAVRTRETMAFSREPVLLPPAEEADAPRLVMKETSNKDY